MVKKSLIVLLLLTFIVPSTGLAKVYENPGDLSFEEIVQIANEEIEELYARPNYFKPFNKNGLPITNNQYVKERNLLVYGDPHNNPDEPNEPKNGRWRYVGYTYSGEDFTNALFPDDARASDPLYERNWVYEPWRSLELWSRVLDTTFDNNPLYEKNIKVGLQTLYGTREFPDSAFANKEWYKYVHVFQPSTYYSWGTGIMWHSNGAWYLSVPIAPFFMTNDLSVSQLWYSPAKDIEPNTEIQTSVLVTNDSEQDITTDIVQYVDGTEVGRWDITVPAKSSIRHNGNSFTTKDVSKMNVKFVVNPERNKPINEIEWNNNEVSKDVPISQDVNVAIFFRNVPDPVEPNESFTFDVVVVNESDKTITTFVKVRDDYKTSELVCVEESIWGGCYREEWKTFNKSMQKTKNITLKPRQEYSYKVTMFSGFDYFDSERGRTSYQLTLTGKVNEGKTFKETTYADNTAVQKVWVNIIPMPESSSHLSK